MSLNEDDKATLHYLRGKVDSLYAMTEDHIEDSKKDKEKLTKLENQVYALWVIGPALTGVIGIIYILKKFFME